MAEVAAEIAAFAEAGVDLGEFVTVEEAARYLGYNNRTITDWLKSGKLRGVRAGRKWMVDRSSLPRIGESRGDASSTLFGAGQHFRVWQGMAGEGFVRAVSVEEITPSQSSTVDLGPLGPEEEIATPVVEVLKLRPDDLVRFKIDVVDDIEVSLVETAVNKPGSRSIGRKVDLFTKESDPSLETTQFWLFGGNWQLKLLVRNPTKYRTERARLRFSGSLIVTKRTDRQEGMMINAVTRGWTT